ncbi:MAG: enoyl-CoA hydratase [Rhodospirillales bacterium]|nr:enoyl-CoA hydratase [Alphaproteobacteria bacterium]MBL6947347.1 enoyl-CoA hydratase [Rhodospirillales bacterium]
MITSPNDTIAVEMQDGICRITFNRPQALNAINRDMAEALKQIAADIRADDAVRVVLLSGAGDHFMAGGDVKSFKDFLDGKPDESEIRAEFEGLIGTVHAFIADFREMPKPVIGSVRGAVAGAGVSLMLACDMVLAAEDAFFTLAYCHLGTAPDGGSTYALPRTVGLKRAFEIALLGDRFDARTALDAGLINRVVAQTDLQAETDKLAERLASGPATAYAQTKALLNASLHRSLEDQLQAEKQAFADCAVTENFAEGVAAFSEKRPPRFTLK